ncbi:adaptin N terminal region-domain-containing protein [Entophlyctis helioformis]|nr:adaptin N terminal region-domain-containing protein [Entophlyctis helioformis]
MSKRDEDSYDDGTLFGRLDKATVLQEARAFNESPINPRRCRIILTKIVYLLHQAQTYQTSEATETFFSISKLFQNSDVSMRQMLYLAIKELSGLSENVFVLMASVTKDMNARAELIYRPNAIRALCKITDASMIPSIERFIKQSIVDKNSAVSSAAIVSSIHLFQLNREVVKRWANEAQEAINSKGVIAQYHALGLLYLMRQHDRMAVIKLVQNYARGSLRSPHAIVMLIRYAYKIMEEEDPATGRALYEHLESWLRHKNDMVVYEAARAICSLRNVTPKELFPAVSALQLMLVNHKPTLRFAAIRTLNKLAMAHPTAVFPCNLDMENLITDSNRSIATFAITTLLKTGNEASVDRLMKQISGFMTEISDEFKIIVVDAVRSLCLKFPSKQMLMLNFLSSALRDDGGYEFKRAIVEAIFDIIHSVPESKEFALSHLCEFIEDCEFTKLAVRILHVLGTEGPRTSSPSKYIRYIYNRVILENSVVRAAAVSALAQFAVSLDDVRDRIKVLLERCTDDTDDEVRDRAALYLSIIRNKELSAKYVANDSTYALATLETKLDHYLKNPASFAQPFDIQSVPQISADQEITDRQRAKAAAQEHSGTGVTAASAPSAHAAGASAGTSVAAAAAAASPFDAQSIYAKAMERVPQLAALGPLFKSSASVELNEAESEYLVVCIKHVFPQHFVFQFECKNTLQDSLLENVSMIMALQASDDPEVAGLSPEFIVPAEKLAFDVPASIYVAFRRNNGVTPVATFANKLKFIVKDCDPNTGEPDEEGFEDEYPPDDVDIVVGDYILPTYVPDFERAWAELGDAHQVVETYALTAVSSIKAAVENLVSLLGMQVIGDATVKDKATTHHMALAGTYVGGVPVAVRARMAYEPSSGVALEIAVRSRHPVVSQKVANAIC